MCSPIHIELQEPGSADGTVEQTVRQFGRLGMLVCNHGYHQIKTRDIQIDGGGVEVP